MAKKVLCLDLGNVLVSWRPPDDVIRDIVKQYGGDTEAIRALFGKESGEKVWEHLELEGITPKAFWRSVCGTAGISPIHLPLEEFMPLYVHDLRAIEPMVSWAYEAQQQGHPLVVISNCDMARGRHVTGFLESFYGLGFLRVFISFEVKIKKPALIQYALTVLREEFGIVPGECIFVDDVPRYVEEASRLGMDAICHNATKDSFEDFYVKLHDRGVILSEKEA